MILPLGDPVATLHDRFVWRCTERAGRDAFIWLADGERQATVQHFGGLLAAARAWSRRITASSSPGDRVLLLLPPGLDFVEAFWGCVLAGRIAVPLPAPDPARLKNALPRLRAVLEDADARLGIIAATDSAKFSELMALLPAPRPEVHWLEAGGAAGSSIGMSPAGVEIGVSGDTIAYLQYTSGSTGSPKGVVLPHRTVLAQADAAIAAMNLTEDDRVLSWLPHHHDYGLVLGLIAPVLAGATSVLMPPMAFLRRPLRWLDAVGRHGITHTGAPNFAFQACVRDVDARPDWVGRLHTLRSATCGAEPIRAETLRAFGERFARHGLRDGCLAPGYGLAEAVLGVTATPTGRPWRAVRDAEGRERVACGVPIQGMAVAIVDPSTATRLPEGATGEIWVQGDSVGTGYWGAPAASAETFDARLPGEPGRWLRTGDLGWLEADELVVAGRLKDLVILGGRNLAPQDLEWTAQAAVPSLRAGHGVAFSVEAAEGEALVLVLESPRMEPVQAGEAERRVREALAEVHEVAPRDVVFVRTGSLPRTSSGKLRRRAAREDYLAGRLQVVARGQAATDDDIPEGTARRLAVLWRHALGRAPASSGDRFFDLGGDSLAATRLASRIQAEFGPEWSVAEVFAHPELGAMAAAIDAAVLAVGARPTGTEAPRRLPRGVDLPVSSSQRRMWMVQQLTPDTTAYNMGFAFAIEGPLSASLLVRAVEAVAARHEAFRTRFVAAGDDVVQRIDPVASTPVLVEDLESAAPEARSELLKARAGDWLQRPFDLGAGPLHRALVLREGPQRHVLVWAIHHAIGDLWSFALLLEDLSRAYAALEAGHAPEWPPKPHEAADYAAWLRDPAREQAVEPQLAAWCRRLADLAVLDLPVDHPRLAPPSGRGGRVVRTLPPDLRTRLAAFAATRQATPFMVLLAVFKALLADWCGQEDVAVGTPIANRHHLAAEPVVGTLVNTVVMRTRIEPGLPFGALVDRVRETALAAYAHQDVPFERLVERLVVNRDATRPPLVPVLFNLVVAPFGELAVAGRRLAPVDIERGGAQFELAVSVDLHVFGQLHVEYASDRFSEATVGRVADAYLALLDAALADPGAAVEGCARGLPARVATATLPFQQTPSPTRPGTAPGQPVPAGEADVLRIAGALLGIDAPSPEDNFFDLGGHSLLALRFAHEVEQATGHRPSILAVAQSSFRALALAAGAARAAQSAGG